MWLRFENGTQGIVRLDLEGLTGVLEPLRREEFLRQVS